MRAPQQMKGHHPRTPVGGRTGPPMMVETGYISRELCDGPKSCVAWPLARSAQKEHEDVDVGR